MNLTHRVHSVHNVPRHPAKHIQCKASTYPILPQFFETYVEHVCPLKGPDLAKESRGLTCLDGLRAPPLMDQASIVDITSKTPEFLRGVIMALLLEGSDESLEKAAFLLSNAQVLDMARGVFLEVEMASLHD